MQVEKINYGGWPNCYRLSNGQIELVITTDVGPRVIRFGFTGEGNEFYEDPRTLGTTGGNAWNIFGGHRLWHSPEVPGRTDVPDNGPLSLEEHGDFARTVQPVEPGVGIQKEMDFALVPDKAQVKVVHRLHNRGPWTVELAPWALSVMAAGGRAILPLPPRGSHTENLLPKNALSMWAYTDMADARWIWGRKYIMLRQDSNQPNPQKIGLTNFEGWAAYARGGHLFLKTFTPQAGVSYPDYESTVEIFTNTDMLELETLGPTVKLNPGQSVEHAENWYLFRDVQEPESDADVDQYVLPKVRSVR
jgi:hypothetical protein